LIELNDGLKAVVKNQPDQFFIINIFLSKLMKNNKCFKIKGEVGMVYLAVLPIITLFVILTTVLVYFSPGIPESLKDEHGNTIKGSISEKLFVPIGGIRQGMFIRSKNINHPVLLYVHGGPGFPNYFLIEKYEPGLEDYFTVCYWEQRGGGLSYTDEISIESMTLEQLASDAVEVTDYLRERFGKEKIYILAHSGGTPIALFALSIAPGNFHAYIAMAQITKQDTSEIIAWEYVLKNFMEKNDKRSVNKMKKFKVETDSGILLFHNSVIRDNAMHQMGIGTMRDMKSVFRDVFISVWTCRAYTIREKLKIWKSKLLFLPKTNLKREILTTDFSASFPRIDVPVYFMSGKYDLTVNVEISKEYYRSLHAPLKGFYTFESSAHSPLFEEPERFRIILEQDVLKSRISLTD
jgi:pimeloyl-ACP methyl ester carboxylesterase